MNDSSPPLEIPEASVQALLAEQDDWDDDSELHRALRDIAAPVVAAELRRIADDIDRGAQPIRVGRAVESSSMRRREGVDMVLAVLRQRADELDPRDGAA